MIGALAVLYLATFALAYAFHRARTEVFRRLERRNDEMARVLEHAHDALLTIDREGRIGAERSKRADELLGHPAAGALLWDVLAMETENTQRVPWLQLSWESIVDDVLPREVALDQMPSRVVLRGRTLDVRVTVIEKNRAVEGALVVLHDVTDELARERAERARRETVAVLGHVRNDPSQVGTFIREIDRLVSNVLAGSEGLRIMRDLHTIKGNAAIFGAESIAEVCHAIEERCAHFEWDQPSADDRLLLAERWTMLSDELASWVCAFALLPHESSSLPRILRRLARQGEALAANVGKEIDVRVVVQPSLCVDTMALEPVLSSLVHALRNAIDHGIAMPDERAAAGKPRRGAIVLSARTDDGMLIIETKDDGNGIAWEDVRERASALGLEVATEDDLVRVLASDGFSTRDSASRLSGRGVGLSGIRDAAEQLGGTLHVVSEDSAGSVLQIRLPLPMGYARGGDEGEETWSAEEQACATPAAA